MDKNEKKSGLLSAADGYRDAAKRSYDLANRVASLEAELDRAKSELAAADNDRRRAIELLRAEAMKG